MVRARGLRAVLDRFGFAKTELHFNEWNYLPDNDWTPMTVKGRPELRERFYDRIGGAEGAAFLACVLVNLQDTPVTVANYYLCDNHGFGLFTFHGVPRKNYHAMRAFRLLLDTPLRVEATGAQPSRLAVCAGMNKEKNKARILIANLREEQPLRLVVRGLPWQGRTQCEMLVLDAAHDRKGRQDGLHAEGLDLSAELKAPAVGLLTLWEGAAPK
jgi:hypothetical protein